MYKYINTLLCLGLAMSVHADNDGMELKVYRKFPNRMLLGSSTLLAGISTAALVVAPKAKDPFIYYMTGSIGAVMAALGFLHQRDAYNHKDKPILIINEKGIWYDGIWFKRNIFLAWDDIKNITWNRTSSGFFYFDSLVIQSHSHFPLTIMASEIDIDIKELWDMIQNFYQGESD